MRLRLRNEDFSLSLFFLGVFGGDGYLVSFSSDEAEVRSSLPPPERKGESATELWLLDYKNPDSDSNLESTR